PPHSSGPEGSCPHRRPRRVPAELVIIVVVAFDGLDVRHQSGIRAGLERPVRIQLPAAPPLDPRRQHDDALRIAEKRPFLGEDGQAPGGYTGINGITVVPIGLLGVALRVPDQPHHGLTLDHHDQAFADLAVLDPLSQIRDTTEDQLLGVFEPGVDDRGFRLSQLATKPLLNVRNGRVSHSERPLIVVRCSYLPGPSTSLRRALSRLYGPGRLLRLPVPLAKQSLPTSIRDAHPDSGRGDQPHHASELEEASETSSL